MIFINLKVLEFKVKCYCNKLDHFGPGKIVAVMRGPLTTFGVCITPRKRQEKKKTTILKNQNKLFHQIGYGIIV